MAVTPEEARRELARRELERRRGAPPAFTGRGVAGLPSFLQGLTGAADVANTAGRAVLGRFAGGLSGAVGLQDSPETAERAFDAITSKSFFNRPPQTQEGQAIMGRVAPFAEAVDTAVTDAFGMVPGGPVPQTIARTAVQAPLEVLGLRGIGSVGAAARAPAVAESAGTFMPEVKDLFKVGRVAFNEARINGGGVRPEALQRAVNSIKNIENEVGLKIKFDPDVHGPAFGARQRILDDLESGAVDFDELMNLRELAGDVAGNKDSAIAMRGMRLKQSIDDFVESLGPQDVVSGDPARAAETLKFARQVWRDASAARTIEREIARAKLAEQANFTTSGIDTALRQKFRALYDSILKGHEKGFTKQEAEAIRKVAVGSRAGNFAREFGKFSPKGVVSTSLGPGVAAGFGFAAGGPVGALAAGTGAAGLGLLARRIANNATIRNAQEALEIPLRNSLLDQ